MKLVSENLNVVSKDSEKIGYDLDLLRESVQGLHIKMDHEADEEEDYYGDWSLTLLNKLTNFNFF